MIVRFGGELGGWVDAEEGEGLVRESGQPVQNNQVLDLFIKSLLTSFKHKILVFEQLVINHHRSGVQEQREM